MSKAEAFARCLQDKLRSLGSGEEDHTTGTDGPKGVETPKTPYGSFSQFTEDEIADHVFLQGPLSYKRRSIPEHSKTYANGKSRDKYIGSLVDKRGMSSDSEDSDVEEEAAAAIAHPRVTQLQGRSIDRLDSVASVDSVSSWCTCDEGPDEDDEEVDNFAAQIKGSPPIHNPRLRNFKRRGREEKHKKESTSPPPQDNEIFFDFDVECFSPVNEDEPDFSEKFENTQPEYLQDGNRWPEDNEEEEAEFTGNAEDTGQRVKIQTPPPSPMNLETESYPTLETILNEEKTAMYENESEQSTTKQSIDFECVPDIADEYSRQSIDYHINECSDSELSSIDLKLVIKDSGICSCEETSSRVGDEPHEIEQEYNTTEEEKTIELGEEAKEEKTPVTSPVMVMCDGVEIDATYLPSPRMKLRRCSSLKTWKTPPGTPGRKKIVRFADALGLDLADVRMFLDEIPKVPNSAFADLHYEVQAPDPTPPPPQRTLIPMFQQPGTQIDFLQKVRQSNVSLESATLTDVALLSISGIVRVRNLSFHKAVHVRYSKDSWATFSDLQATFVPNSSDGFCDNFSFTLYGHTLGIGDRLEFAIRYDCGVGQFWDNNNGTNYVFQCMPRNNLTLFPPLGTSPDDTWTKFY